MPPKYQLLAASLRQSILDGTYPPASLLPTEQALCESSGYSRQTVRSALGELVRDGFIERVQGRGSVVLRRAPSATAQPRSVAVITTYISNYIFPSLLRDIETELTANRCIPLLFSTNNLFSVERQALQALLLSPSLDGVIVEGTKTTLPNPNLGLYRELLGRGVPLVFINGCCAELRSLPCVFDDNAAGGRMLVEYLAKKGHKKIAGLFKSDDIQGQQRFSGYMEGLAACGLELDDSRLFWYDTQSLNSLSSPEHDLAPALLGALDGCTAAVCYNDEAALRLVHGLLRRGLRVPEDMAVVSFDNSRLAELCPRPLTSLSHGAHSVGKTAVQTLLARMEGRDAPSVEVPWELIERESG